MSAPLCEFHFDSPDQTAGFAVQLGAVLNPGDTVLLEGGVGAGKTFLARCLIQSILSEPEDVPSPTFTLIQSYDTEKGPLLHADLYRLGSLDDVFETGLVDAFGTEICIVEWPDRLGSEAPENALTLSLTLGVAPEQRKMVSSSRDPSWRARMIGFENV